jgi:hypothetical protein
MGIEIPPDKPTDPYPDPPEECPDIDHYLPYSFEFDIGYNGCEVFTCEELATLATPAVFSVDHPECESCRLAWYVLESCFCVYNAETLLTLVDATWHFLGCSGSGGDPPPDPGPTDLEAFTLAETYGLMPARSGSKTAGTSPVSGKYEPDHTPTAETRFMVLAHWQDGSNVLVKYNPAELETD